jgi:hypothetical protein
MTYLYSNLFFVFVCLLLTQKPRFLSLAILTQPVYSNVLDASKLFAILEVYPHLESVFPVHKLHFRFISSILLVPLSVF